MIYKRFRELVEFNKQFFEAAFKKPVEVKLLQSIINGGDFCEFEIKG